VRIAGGFALCRSSGDHGTLFEGGGWGSDIGGGGLAVWLLGSGLCILGLVGKSWIYHEGKPAKRQDDVGRPEGSGLE